MSFGLVYTNDSKNYIKRQAREHETFRKLCVSFAQNLHRVDMRLRLGLLQDPAAIDRQIAREAAEAEARRKALKRDSSVPTVLTEAQMKLAKDLSEEERKKIEERVKNEEKSKTERRIRPLSEAKAIDSGANFLSEAFLFLVAGGLIVFETFRSRRKEATRQRGVEDRLKDLEEEITGLEEERDKYRELIEDFKEVLEMVKTQKGAVDENRVRELEKDLKEAKEEDSAQDSSTATATATESKPAEVNKDERTNAVSETSPPR